MSMEQNRPKIDDVSATSAETAPTSTAPGSTPEPASVSAAEYRPEAGKSVLREYAEAIVVAMLLAFAIRIFIVQAFKIPSGSMIPTLLIGDHILVNKMAYGLQWPTDCKFEWTGPINLTPKHWRLPVNCYSSTAILPFGTPQRGDIIVFRFPDDEEKDFIKRIVGLPGDTIQIRNKVVYVNGQMLDDKLYTQRVDPGLIDGTVSPRDNFGPVTVPEGSYFMMGDNRDQSLDSRFWGYVRMEKIRGKAFRIYWSWSGDGKWSEWVRWERLGKAIR